MPLLVVGPHRPRAGRPHPGCPRRPSVASPRKLGASGGRSPRSDLEVSAFPDSKCTTRGPRVCPVWAPPTEIPEKGCPGPSVQGAHPARGPGLHASARVLVPGAHPGLDTQKEEPRGPRALDPSRWGSRSRRAGRGHFTGACTRLPGVKNRIHASHFCPLDTPGCGGDVRGVNRRGGNSKAKWERQLHPAGHGELNPRGAAGSRSEPRTQESGRRPPACGVEVELTGGRWQGCRRAPRSSLPGPWLGPPVCPAGAQRPQRLTPGRNHTFTALDPIRPTPSVGELPENPEMERNPSPEM